MSQRAYLILKVGRGSRCFNIDDLQVKLTYSNKSAQNFMVVLLWSEIFNSWKYRTMDYFLLDYRY